MKKNIAILAGGDSSEYEISLKTAKQIFDQIDTNKFNPNIVIIRGKDWYLQDDMFKDVPINKDDFTLRVNNFSKTIFDCVVMAIHGTPAEDGKLAAYFELIGIPYTSCGLFASTLTYNKYQCNVFLQSFGISVPKSLLFTTQDIIRPSFVAQNVGLPCFVKPNTSGSSFGITKVANSNKLLSATEFAFNESSEITIEQCISGKEVTCGIVKTKSKEIILPLTEIVHKKEFFDYEAKYNPENTSRITPAKLDEDMDIECKKLSSQIYEVLDCKGLVRIDYIISGDKIYFLEVNTIPDMSEASIISEQCRAAGLSLSDLYTELIEDAIEDKGN